MVVVAAAGWMATPGSVHAQDWHWRRGEPPDLAHEQGGVAGELSFYAGDGGSVISPVVGGWYVIGDHGIVSLDWGAAFARDGEVDRGLGNAVLAGAYAIEMDGMRVELQLGLGLPASAARSGDVSVDYLAADIRGWWNLWAWWPDAVSPFGQVHAESIDDHIHFALDLGIGAAVPVTDAAEWEIPAQFAFEGGWRDDWGAAGLRLQGVWLGHGDVFQSALEPFLRVEAGPAYISVRGTLNLDEPLGVAGSGANLWAVHIGVGGTLRPGRRHAEAPKLED